MRDDSKKLLEKVIADCKEISENLQKNPDGSIDIKLSNKNVKEILGKQRIKEGLKNNLVDDLKDLNASICDTNSLCLTIPKSKLEKTIISYDEIQKKIEEKNK